MAQDLTRGDGARWPTALLWALMLGGLAVMAAWPLALLPLHISYNNNEGWNAYWAARAMAHEPLYTDAASPITNNYPPLSFYVAGYAGRAIGDMILAGRLVSLACLLACAWMIRVAVRRLGDDARWADAAGILFLVFVGTAAWRYIATDDPQWLAQALMLGGVLLLLDQPPVPATRIAGACLLMLLGGLVKHSQLALPIAATAWLAIHDRRGLLVWLATAAIGGALALWIVASAFGPAFFAEVLHHQRMFQPRFLRTSLSTLATVLPAIVLAGILAPQRRGDPRLTLLFLFAILALVIGIAERAGQGVAQNAHFDAAEAFLLLAGVALARHAGVLAQPRARQIAFAALLVPMLIVLPGRLVRTTHQLAALGATRAEWRRAIAFLASRPGPIACERLALCYWAGKPQALDFFNYGQKLKRGHDPAGLAQQITAQRFGAIVRLDDTKGVAGRERLTPAYDSLIAARYHVVQTLTDDLFVLAPRGR